MECIWQMWVKESSTAVGRLFIVRWAAMVEVRRFGPTRRALGGESFPAAAQRAVCVFVAAILAHE